MSTKNSEHRKQTNSAALKPYLDCGYTLIPLHRHDSKSRYRGRDRKDGKRPRDFNWTTKAYASEAVAKEAARANCNVGVRLTPGDLVIDVDPRNGGTEGFERLCEDLRLNPAEWPRVETGSGGSHYYLRKRQHVEVVDTLKAYKGVEFKSRGRQVVAAGSIRPDTGKHYTWDADHPELSDAPECPKSLLGAIKRPKHEGVSRGGQYTQEQIATALDKIDVTKFREHSAWLQIMMAVHHASGGDARSEFVEWSCGDPQYSQEADIIGRRWDSLHAEKNDGITYRTFEKIIREHGDVNTMVAREDAADDFDAPVDEDPSTMTFENDYDVDGGFDSGLSFKLASEIEPEPIKWLWPGRFPIGKLSMIAGFPDQGKSQVTMNIAATVSTGGEWPNSEGRAEQGAVLVLSAEDDPADTIVPRLKAAGADLTRCIVVNSIVRIEGSPRVFNLSDDLARLEAEFKDHDVKLVIVDPIGAYMGGKAKGDSFKNAEVRALLTPLAEWASRLKVAVIAISHFNKGGNGRALYRVTDSLAFTAAARAVWLTAEEEETDRKLFLKGKSNLAGDPGGLAYKIEGVDIGDGINAPRIVWDGTVDITADEALQDGEGRRDATLQDAMAFLLHELKDGLSPSSEVQKAAAKASISGATLRRAREKLGVFSARSGGIGSKGYWYWGLPKDKDWDEAAE